MGRVASLGEPEKVRAVKERGFQAASSAATGLELLGVTKRFGDTLALDAVTLRVPLGHVVGFLGPNGAGKTTAMRAMCGLVTIDAGEVLWDGRVPGRTDRLRFGYMPEERGLYPRMELGAQLVYFGRLHGLGGDDARAAAQMWLERLGLVDRADAKVEELSHGNQQRAQLAVALLHRPDVLLLDEPFAGLDPLAVRTLAEVLRSEAARGAAVMFSSHQLELVEHVCEDVAIIDDGRIVATGRLDALRRESRQRRIELTLEGGPAGWTPEVDGVRLVERRDGHLLLAADCDVDPERLLAAAKQHATVVAFTYGPPSLSDLFLELVER